MNLWPYLILSLLLCPLLGVASFLDLTEREVQEVMRIAKSISLVQPGLADHKYIEYAVGIYRASRKYSIDHQVLAAITKFETQFREDLAEGRAGEIGICQILKRWLKNPIFKREFGVLSIGDLRKPSKSFMYAAWILKDLKESVPQGALPYWSYYNARKFENRLKYFIAVNKNLVALRKNDPLLSDDAAPIANTVLRFRNLASTKTPVAYASPSEIVSRSYNGQWAPNSTSSLPTQRQKLGQSVKRKSSNLPGEVASVASTPLLRVAADLGVSSYWLVDLLPQND